MIAAFGLACYALLYVWLGAGPEEREALALARWQLRATYVRLKTY
jgi:hypothetical protein